MITTSKDLALAIKAARKQQHLSQAAMGDSVGMRQATISGFENQPEQTKLETVFRLLAVLDLELKIIPRDKKKNQHNWKEEW